MNFRAFLCLLAALAFGQPAFAAIGTPLALGFNATTGTGGHTMTASTATSAGDALLVTVSCPSTATPSTPTDTKGNTYVQIGTGFTTSGYGTEKTVHTYIALNTTALTTSDSASLTYGSSTASQSILYVIPGVATASAVDAIGTAATGTSSTTGPTVTTGTMAETTEIAIGIDIVNLTSGTPPTTAGTGFTYMSSTAGGGSRVLIYYKTPVGTASESFTPTFPSAAVWADQAFTLKAAGGGGGGGSPASTLGLLNVGS